MTARASRRQILAAIALADAPTPHNISFVDDGGVIGITLDRIADLHPWADLTGATAAQLGQALTGVTTHTNDATGEIRRQTSLYPTWLGWRVSLIAAETVDTTPVEPLDDATREQLAAIVASEPDSTPAATHREVAGWVGGGPGQSGVECACGTTFDGFDTIAEAAALLDAHIAALSSEAGAPC